MMSLDSVDRYYPDWGAIASTRRRKIMNNRVTCMHGALSIMMMSLFFFFFFLYFNAFTFTSGYRNIDINII